MDNATKNDTMVLALGQHILSINSQHRLRCAGHILNLVVKTILYGKEITEFNKNIIGCSDSEAFDLWRKVGVIGKVHNTVKYMMRSDQRRHLFIEMQGQNQERGSDGDYIFKHACLLVKDRGVRYHMLYRAIQLPTAITTFQDRPVDEDPREVSYSASEDRILPEDWDLVRQYLKLIGPFVDATRHLEGNAEHEGKKALEAPSGKCLSGWRRSTAT